MTDKILKNRHDEYFRWVLQEFTDGKWQDIKYSSLSYEHQISVEACKSLLGFYGYSTRDDALKAADNFVRAHIFKKLKIVQRNVSLSTKIVVTENYQDEECVLSHGD